MERVIAVTIYSLTVITLLTDVWGLEAKPHIDIYGRLALSFFVVAVICPLYTFSTLSLFYRCSLALKRKSLRSLLTPATPFGEMLIPGDFSPDGHNTGKMLETARFLMISILSAFPLTLPLTLILV